MKKKIVRLLIIIIFILFISSYIVTESGYHEYKLQERVVLTSEKIKEFEEDIKNNQKIDAKEYLVKDTDYSNKITNIAYNISNNMDKLFKKCLKALFKRLSHLVED